MPSEIAAAIRLAVDAVTNARKRIKRAYEKALTGRLSEEVSQK
jgi:hypothetical protein